MLKYLNILLLFSCFLIKCFAKDDDSSEGKVIPIKSFMLWPNATVPFFINPDHFDLEQSTIIMTCLSMIAFRTCLKFAPVMIAPHDGQHVMTFINPQGIKRCNIELKGHSNYDPHLVLVGYECLKSPEIDMLVLRALGLPFEHNRMNRDLYIEVLVTNIEPNYVELFTKDNILPPVLRGLPYDINSAMHFGERDYSKNGHRTIIFKVIKSGQPDILLIQTLLRDYAVNPNASQKRYGMSPLDVKRIEFIYGSECRKRDRAEKVTLCQSYPGISRRKREIVEPPVNKSLRVNPYITPPPHILAGATDTEIQTTMANTKQECSLKTLGIFTEADKIIDSVYQLSNLALKNARQKYCNISSNSSSDFDYENAQSNSNTSDVFGILQILAEFAKSIVNDAERNTTEFCQNSETIEAYQSQCKFDNDARCPKNYRASKSEAETVTNDSEQVNKSQEIDDHPTPASLKSNRRKREATTAQSPEEKNEKVVHKDNITEKFAQKENFKEKKSQRENEIKNEVGTEMSLKHKLNAIRKERLKEIQNRNSTTTKLYMVSPTPNITFKVKEDTKELIRKSNYKRYKIQDRENSGDESDVTLEATAVIEPEKSIKDLLVKGLDLVMQPAIVAKVVEIAESVQIKEEPKIKTGRKKKSAEEVSEEKIQDKADKSTKETKSEELKVVEEKPQYNQNAKKTKRKIPKTVELSQLNIEFYKERKWPDGEIIYAIENLQDYDIGDLRHRLEEVNIILKEKTCVKLREVPTKEAPGFDDFLILDKSPDYVTGRVGRRQNFGAIELFEGGQHKQHTAMMVMAMLGFYFEVARHDRDKYIRVHNRHIRPDKLHHFEKLAPEATLNITYDYKSATHPPYQFWRKIGKTNLATVATYKTRDPDGSIMHAIGENEELLSKSDILKINSVYGVGCFQSNRARKEKESALRLLEEEEMIIQ